MAIAKSTHIDPRTVLHQTADSLACRVILDSPPRAEWLVGGLFETAKYLDLVPNPPFLRILTSTVVPQLRMLAIREVAGLIPADVFQTDQLPAARREYVRAVNLPAGGGGVVDWQHELYVAWMREGAHQAAVESLRVQGVRDLLLAMTRTMVLELDPRQRCTGAAPPYVAGRTHKDVLHAINQTADAALAGADSERIRSRVRSLVRNFATETQTFCEQVGRASRDRAVN